MQLDRVRGGSHGARARRSYPLPLTMVTEAPAVA
jgi:hypothetical protein